MIMKRRLFSLFVALAMVVTVVGAIAMPYSEATEAALEIEETLWEFSGIQPIAGDADLVLRPNFWTRTRSDSTASANNPVGNNAISAGAIHFGMEGFLRFAVDTNLRNIIINDPSFEVNLQVAAQIEGSRAPNQQFRVMAVPADKVQYVTTDMTFATSIADGIAYRTTTNNAPFYLTGNYPANTTYAISPVITTTTTSPRQLVLVDVTDVIVEYFTNNPTVFDIALILVIDQVNPGGYLTTTAGVEVSNLVHIGVYATENPTYNLVSPTLQMYFNTPYVDPRTGASFNVTAVRSATAANVAEVTVTGTNEMDVVSVQITCGVTGAVVGSTNNILGGDGSTSFNVGPISFSDGNDDSYDVNVTVTNILGNLLNPAPGFVELWTRNVVFNSNGGTRVPALNLVSGGPVAQPPNPSRGQFWSFTGWFTNQEATSSWNFNSPISALTADSNGTVTLFAGWNLIGQPPEQAVNIIYPNLRTLTRSDGGGNTIQTINVGTNNFAAQFGNVPRIQELFLRFSLTDEQIDFLLNDGSFSSDLQLTLSAEAGFLTPQPRIRAVAVPAENISGVRPNMTFLSSLQDGVAYRRTNAADGLGNNNAHSINANMINAISSPPSNIITTAWPDINIYSVDLTELLRDYFIKYPEMNDIALIIVLDRTPVVVADHSMIRLGVYPTENEAASQVNPRMRFHFDYLDNRLPSAFGIASLTQSTTNPTAVTIDLNGVQPTDVVDVEFRSGGAYRVVRGISATAGVPFDVAIPFFPENDDNYQVIVTITNAVDVIRFRNDGIFDPSQHPRPLNNIPTRRVVFDSNEGSPVPEQAVMHNGLVTAPNPETERAEWELLGWFTYPQDRIPSGSADFQWNFAVNRIGQAEVTTLYAHWQPTLVAPIERSVRSNLSRRTRSDNPLQTWVSPGNNQMSTGAIGFIIESFIRFDELTDIEVDRIRNDPTFTASFAVSAATEGGRLQNQRFRVMAIPNERLGGVRDGMTFATTYADNIAFRMVPNQSLELVGQVGIGEPIGNYPANVVYALSEEISSNRVMTTVDVTEVLVDHFTRYPAARTIAFIMVIDEVDPRAVNSQDFVPYTNLIHLGADYAIENPAANQINPTLTISYLVDNRVDGQVEIDLAKSTNEGFVTICTTYAHRTDTIAVAFTSNGHTETVYVDYNNNEPFDVQVPWFVQNNQMFNITATITNAGTPPRLMATETITGVQIYTLYVEFDNDMPTIFGIPQTGQNITPPIPQSPNQVFGGWESAGGVLWNFATMPITAPMAFTATWRVPVVDQNGDVVDISNLADATQLVVSTTVANGTTVQPVIALYGANNRFMGYYFPAPVTVAGGNITFAVSGLSPDAVSALIVTWNSFADMNPLAYAITLQ
ncbi:MAG: InlB B-repeat-containing protein [Oscillospiraceae bacterium]|nr:InlB B-repeat-containing protein [Oscillospiraceae bacterium]